MNDDIRTLIDSLRRGDYESPDEKIELLSAALQEYKAGVPELLALLRAPQPTLRAAGAGACRGRTEPELLSELLKLAADPDGRVRHRLATVAESIPAELAKGALEVLLQDPVSSVRSAALKSTGGREEFLQAQCRVMMDDTDWDVCEAAANALGQRSGPGTTAALFRGIADACPPAARRCAELLEKRLELDGATADAFPDETALVNRAEQALKEMGGRFARLKQWLNGRAATQPNLEVLATFGTDLTRHALDGTLPRGHGLEEFCQTVLQMLARERWRSIALLGPAGSGKTALVNELAYELAKPENGAWRVLRVSPSDFMAGTKYLGEWETRVKELVDATRRPRRVLIYVPNLSDLAAAGRWSKSDSNVATALAPYMEEGSVVLLGENTPEQFERGIGSIPTLQRLFDRVLLPERSVDQTEAILRAVRDEQKLPIADGVLRQLLEAATQFLSHISLPGSAVSLLRAVIQYAEETNQPVRFRDVLDSLSKSTGLPANLLDDSIPLDQAVVRRFFEQRIIGQPEAVDAVVDLVTLIKAGLTDPQKPFSVMLFIGPTGVGKTELARSLAEFIFGDAARLKRFDMSEYASQDGFVRLIGSPQESGLLTDAVRQQPFSVLLFDEIEKSHLNVFDLCLQVFDAGRLTDGRGQTLDFRRTILILTSNIGASAPSPGFGFKPESAAEVPEADKDRTFRELTRFFRPEFLNRLDRIVQFRPLSLEVAEQIARREIDLVLQRSGIRRRALVVEVVPSVVSLLVREGYSPHFGARPLKRTVERLVLLPLARAISGGGLPDRTILRLKDNGGRVDVAVIKPPKPPPASEKPENRATRSIEAELSALLAAYDQLEPRVQPMAERKSELLLQTQVRGFYDDVPRRTAVFDEIQKLDQFIELQRGLGKALAGLQERLRQHPPTLNEEPALRDRIAQLGAELQQLRSIAECRNAQDLGDVLLCLSLVEQTGAPLHALPKLAGMYQGLAQKRRMTSEVLGEFVDGRKDRAWLLISGLGAFRLLKNEAGLHQLDYRTREKAPRSGHETVRDHRETVRVEVLALRNDPDKQFRRGVRSKVASLRNAPGSLLEKPQLSLSLFHEASLRSLDLWTAGPKSRALENAILILNTLVAGNPDQGSTDQVVRHYELGLSRRVKDTRSGRTTTAVDRVLKGNLDALLVPDPN